MPKDWIQILDYQRSTTLVYAVQDDLDGNGKPDTIKVENKHKKNLSTGYTDELKISVHYDDGYKQTLDTFLQQSIPAPITYCLDFFSYQPKPPKPYLHYDRVGQVFEVQIGQNQKKYPF